MCGYLKQDHMENWKTKWTYRADQMVQEVPKSQTVWWRVYSELSNQDKACAPGHSLCAIQGKVTGVKTGKLGTHRERCGPCWWTQSFPPPFFFFHKKTVEEHSISGREGHHSSSGDLFPQQFGEVGEEVGKAPVKEGRSNEWKLSIKKYRHTLIRTWCLWHRQQDKTPSKREETPFLEQWVLRKSSNPLH